MKAHIKMTLRRQPPAFICTHFLETAIFPVGCGKRQCDRARFCRTQPGKILPKQGSHHDTKLRINRPRRQKSRRKIPRIHSYVTLS